MENNQIEQPVVETTQVDTTTVHTEENIENITTQAVEEKPTIATIQEPIKPFELPKQSNPISFDKPEDVLSAYKGDKKVLLKQLGELDDFALGLIDYYKATGDVTPYLEVKSVDWTKQPTEKVIERMLREQYSDTGLPEDKVQKLIQRDLRTKYMLGDEHDSESEDVQIARIQMEVDANKFRKQLIEKQQQFKVPERVQEETPTISPEQLMEQSRNELLQDQSIQSFIKDKKVSFGDYNHVIENPQETLQTIYDTNKWQYLLSQKTADGQMMVDANGSPVLDKGKMLLMATIAENPDKVFQGLIAYGKSLGQKEIIEEAENVQDRKTEGSEAPTDSFWKTFQKEARFVQ